MATKAEIKSYIKSRVKTNTTHDITGDHLQETLCKMIDDLDLGGGSTSGPTQKYVDQQDAATLNSAKAYTDSKVTDSLSIYDVSTEALAKTAFPKVQADLAAGRAAFMKFSTSEIIPVQSYSSDQIQGYQSKTGADGQMMVTTYTVKSTGSKTVSTSSISPSTLTIVDLKSTTYNELRAAYQANPKGALAVQTGDVRFIYITLCDLSQFIGYWMTFNSGTLSDGSLGVVSTTITRYTWTADGLDRTSFVVSSNSSGGGGSTTLTWAYSDYAGSDTPADPDTKPSLWYSTKKDSSVWCALKETGGSWNIWRLLPYAGDPGESALVVDLDNEIEACALTYEGLTPSSSTLTPVVSAYYGLTKLSIDSIETSVVGTSNVTVSANKSTGVITVSWGAGVALNTFSVVIEVTVTVKGTSYTRTVNFTVNCVKAGAPGEDAILYKLRPSVSNILKYVDGSYSVASISCQKLKVQGNRIEETQDGILSYSIDGASSKTYTGPIASSSISKKIRFEYRVNNLLWDAEDVFLMEDGKTLTVTKTEYKYALTMGHTVPADDAWSDTPVAGLPGQYLWVKTIYTWSDGSTTYSLSYARCGSDGADGTGADGKTSVTMFRGTWTPEGKYTGTIDGNVMRADIVYYKAAGEVDGKYYMALATKGFVNSTTPAPNTTAGKSYWGEFQGQYANIATGLLFTEKAIIENATVRSLKTADEGARIETQGNQMASYDEDGVQRISLDPEGYQPFSILPQSFSGSPLRNRGFYGITIPSQLGGKSYTGGKLVIDSYQGTDAQLAEDAKMVAIMTGCTLAEATMALENDTSINIQVNNSESNLQEYILANAKGIFNFASQSYETVNTRKLYIGWDADGQGALETGTTHWYATLAEDVTLGSKADIIKPTGVNPEDRYSFNSQMVNLAFLPSFSDTTFVIKHSSSTTVGKIQNIDGELYGRLVLVNKQTGQEIIFMNLLHEGGPYSEGGIRLGNLMSQSQIDCPLTEITTSGTKLPETSYANTPQEVPEIPLGIYDIKIKFTTRVDTLGTGWNTVGQGISFTVSLQDSDERDGTLSLRVYPQSRALSINSQGISVVRSAQEYFQLGFKETSDQSDNNLDLEVVMGDHLLKMNSLESYFGPRNLYGIGSKYSAGNYYHLIDILPYQEDLSVLTLSYSTLRTILTQYPIFLRTWMGFLPLVLSYDDSGHEAGLCASVSTGIVGNGLSNPVTHYFFISTAGKVSYFFQSL